MNFEKTIIKASYDELVRRIEAAQDILQEALSEVEPGEDGTIRSDTKYNKLVVTLTDVLDGKEI